MAEQSGFFDAHLVGDTYDRVYLAENFAKYFASFIGNGIFGQKLNELAIYQKDTADMSVKVTSGQAYINGYWYENDDDIFLSIDVADGVLNRIDLVVLRWDNSQRVIRLAVKKGVASSVAYPPSILRNDDYYELKLAEIYVPAGATNILQANITDTRLNAEACGLVTGVVEQLDTTDLGNQLQSYIDGFAARYKEYLENLEAENTEEIDTIINNFVKWIEDTKTENTSEIDALINGFSIWIQNEKIELDAIVADNDLVILSRDVTALKKQMIESAEYRGCYYRIFQERTEWLNPPNQPGIEYCTTERWNNKPVYQKIFYAASLPNNTTMTLEVDSQFTAIVSITGFALDTDNNLYHPFPIIVSGVTPIAVISQFEGDGGDGGIVIIKTTADVTNYQAYITVKYTKT